MQPQKAEDGARELLRHTLATLAYRAAKAFRNAPGSFENLAVSETSRTPGQILAHLADLMDWAVSIARGKQEWHDSSSVAWEQGVRRFFASLEDLDHLLASDQPLPVPCGKLFQGAIADAFTHLGQIAMLRRIAGSPIRAENYFRAEIVVGQVGPEQSQPRREFD